MDNHSSQKKTHKKLRNWLITFAIIIVVSVVSLWPTDYFIESPGQAFEVGQFMETKRKKSNNLYMVTVSVTSRPANVLQYLWSYTQPFDSRTPSSELLGNQTSSQYEELQNWYMETSQQNAIYYAAKKAGLKPKLKYLGVYVMDIQKNSSFKNKLQIGDTVLGTNGHRFHSTRQMQNYLNSQKAGSTVKILVMRNKAKKTFTGKIVKLSNSNRKGIGIQLVEHVDVQTKPAFSINAENIGGSSAGLMFSLESYQIFTKQNLTKNHKVAGTGTIDPTGKVGIIGGVDKKVVAANKAGAEVFFAPTDRSGVKKSETNYEVAKRTAKRIHSKMKIVPVANFEDALSYLQKHY